jgi:hypothetical protein
MVGAGTTNVNALFYKGKTTRGICPVDGKEHSSEGSHNYTLQTIE